MFYNRIMLLYKVVIQYYLLEVFFFYLYAGCLSSTDSLEDDLEEVLSVLHQRLV